MKKKVFLLYPPSPVLNREDRCQQPVKELCTIPALPPTDLLYLGAVSEMADCKAMIKDYSLGGNFLADLEEFQPDYIVVNVAMPTFESDLDVLKKAKEKFPKVVTIAKGAPFLVNSRDTLYNYKFVDLIIIGEAEETLKEILEGKEYKDILGLTYRDGFVVKYTGKRPFIEDLDELPFPARHLIDNNVYVRPDNNKPQAVIKVSRGCPHYCFFCLATPVSGSTVRMRSVENILAEIQECVSKYKITNFIFWSDFFTNDKTWVKDLCNAILGNKLKITWSCNTRVDSLDESMLKLMRKAGCKLMSIGVESGSQFILDKIGKNTTLFEIADAVKLIKKAKIKTYAYFVIGLPWDDEYTIQQTINFSLELNPDFVNFYTAVPLPATRFYYYAQQHELFEKETTYKNAYYYPTVKTHCLTKERVMELQKLANKRFYLRFSYIMKVLSNIRSVTEFKNYFKAGINMLMNIINN